MDLKIVSVEADKKSLEPVLAVCVELEYFEGIEAPLFISGYFNSTDGKTVGYLQECHLSARHEYKYSLQMLTQSSKDDIYNNGNKYKHSYLAKLTAPLSMKAIDHLEQLRQETPEKMVILNFNFVVKALQLPFEPKESLLTKNFGQKIISVVTETKHGYIQIKQSDWINHYSNLLGIGSFLLVEFRIPDKHKVDPYWSALYDKLYARVVEMEQSLSLGDWQKTMAIARKFFENIKLNDSKSSDKMLKDKLKVLFLNEQHTEEGFNDFAKAIFHFHQFISKYIHEKDQEGNFIPDVIPTKEDAYFAYTLSISLLNVIGKKISKNP